MSTKWRHSLPALGCPTAEVDFMSSEDDFEILAWVASLLNRSSKLTIDLTMYAHHQPHHPGSPSRLTIQTRLPAHYPNSLCRLTVPISLCWLTIQIPSSPLRVDLYRGLRPAQTEQADIALAHNSEDSSLYVQHLFKHQLRTLTSS